MKRALFHDDASPRLAIGLMSGTSADGIDAALVEISGCSTDTRVRLLSFLTLPFSDAARARILRVAAGDFGGTEELCLLNFYLGELSADACEAVCVQAGVAPDKVSFVGSHGQTVFHAPDAREYLGRPVRGTLQTGEASVIAERLGCPVVSDFRVRDMAAGGIPRSSSRSLITPSCFYIARNHCRFRNICSTAGRTRAYCSKISAASAISPYFPKAVP